MKFSVSLGQYYSNVDIASIPREELLQKIGAQLGAIEEVIDFGAKYEGVVVAKVVKCDKHPDADRLNVCLLNDGNVIKDVARNEDGLVTVVCGASNVREGLLVAWLPPGTTVPSTFASDPFVLEARELRGVVSNGMIASPKELGISDEHDGILEIDEEAVPGQPFKELYGLDDLIIDCENKMFTHRPDCFGNLGIAREIAGITRQAFRSPDWYMQTAVHIDDVSNELSFESKNEIVELVPRFVARVVEGVSVQSSPIWLQASLTKVGIKPINNIVDWTNYYMHLTGQPTHAFDYDKIKQHSSGTPTIFPRLAQKGEKLTLLGGKTIELGESDIVIATDQTPVALAGIMGGADTEVDASTKNIIIECATFDMYSVRRSSMRHGLFTEASTRFTKDQSELQNMVVLNKLSQDICNQTKARIGLTFDLKDEALSWQDKNTFVSKQTIETLLGKKFETKELVGLLENVEFEYVGETDGLLQFKIPFWRKDISWGTHDKNDDINSVASADMAEEVGRLYGYDNLPIGLPPRSSQATPKDELFEYKKSLRSSLKAAGANEILSYNFVHGDLLRKTGLDPEKWAFHIRNALSPNLQYYRTSLIASLLEKVHPNIKARAGSDDNEFAIFEIGKAHVKDHNDEEGLPEEFERLCLVVAADDKTANSKYAGASYYQALAYLKQVLGFEPHLLELKESEYPITLAFAPGRSAMVSTSESPEDVFGIIGEFKPELRKSLKLPEHCAGFELDIRLMLANQGQSGYKTLSEYPKTHQDITFETANEMKFAEVKKAIEAELAKSSERHGYDYTVTARDIFADQQSGNKRLTFRIQLSHPNRTLTTEETNTLLDDISEGASKSGLKRI